MKKEHYVIFVLVLIIVVGSVVFYYETKGVPSIEDTEEKSSEEEKPITKSDSTDAEKVTTAPVEENTPGDGEPVVYFDDAPDHTYQKQYPDEFENPKKYIRLSIGESPRTNPLSISSSIIIEFTAFSIAKEAHYSNLMIGIIWQNENEDVVKYEKELIKLELRPGTQKGYKLKTYIPDGATKADLEVISADALI